MKVVLLGKEFCGKTSLVERYLNDRFLDSPYQNTIGAAFGAKRIDVRNRKITVGIWDTAGSERYEAMSRIYYRGARGAIVCYDLTDDTGFERAKFWVAELKKNEENCQVYLCGTKKDIVDDNPDRRKVSTSQIVRYATEINAEAFETSSKSGENVGDLFYKIAEDYVRDSRNLNNQNTDEPVQLSDTTKKGILPCC